MNTLFVYTKSYPQNFSMRIYTDSGFKQSRKIHRNRIEHGKHLNSIADAIIQKPMLSRRVKKFILGLAFLIAFCFAVVDSSDFTFFLLTKVAAVSLFLLAYVESRSLWNRRARISDQERYGVEDSRTVTIGVMRFFERRNPKVYSVLFERPLRKDQVSISGMIRLTKGK